MLGEWRQDGTTMAFCDFCTCENCTDGAPDLFHAQAVDGRWICDVCFLYDQCTSDDGPAPRNPNGPCDNSECEHRPRLINPQGPDRWIAWVETPVVDATTKEP